MWRVVLSPRWLGWHLLAVVAVAGCAAAAVWQWSRAGSAMGSALNVGYGIQWPIFAVFFAYMWLRFLRLDLIAAREATDPDAVPGHEAGHPGGGLSARPEAGRPGHESLEPLPGQVEVDSPFTRSPVREVAPVGEREAPALLEYNRMLAALAAADRPDSDSR